MKEYFYCISNNLIRCELPDTKFICTCYIVGQIRGINDKGIISIKYILENCGYSQHSGKDRINKVYESNLQKLIDDNKITLDQGYTFPLKNISNAVPYTINADLFDCKSDFTKLTEREFNALIRYNPDKNKENMLALYLYVKSFYHRDTVGNRPIGFYHSIESINKVMGYSERIICEMLKNLTDMGLLHKYVVGSRWVGKGRGRRRKNVPNIYIPDLGQTPVELDETFRSTRQEMKEYYEKEYHMKGDFLPFMQGK